MLKIIPACIPWVFFLSLTVGTGSENKNEDDLRIIRDRVSLELMDSLVKNASDDGKKVPIWVNDATLHDGKWSDIDYATQSSAAWGPAQHLERVRILAGLYQAKNQGYYLDPKILEVIQKSLDYFKKNNFMNYNWWFNEVGVPITIGQILILTRDQLGLKLFEYSNFFMHREMSFQSTGQNFAWRAQIWIYRGLIESDPILINKAVKAMEDEIKTKQFPGYKKE